MGEMGVCDVCFDNLHHHRLDSLVVHCDPSLLVTIMCDCVDDN